MPSALPPVQGALRPRSPPFRGKITPSYYAYRTSPGGVGPIRHKIKSHLPISRRGWRPYCLSPRARARRGANPLLPLAPRSCAYVIPLAVLMRRWRCNSPQSRPGSGPSPASSPAPSTSRPWSWKLWKLRWPERPDLATGRVFWYLLDASL